MPRTSFKILSLVAVITAATACSSGRSSPSEGPSVNANPKTLKNPVPATPESLATGKRLYDRLCAECHGATGHGDGEKAKKLAEAGEPKAPDLTDDKWDHGSTEGEIFVDIRDGLGSTMRGLNGKPGIGPEEIWHLVNYVRSLGANK
jgi:mono/diheme cytochrome c family protein